MPNSTHYELHQARVYFYPTGSQLRYSELCDLHIVTPREWEDRIEPYPENLNDDPLVTVQSDFVAIEFTWSRDGLYQGFIEYEVDNMGLSDTFASDELIPLIEPARAYLNVWIERAKQNDPHFLDFRYVDVFVLWRVEIKTPRDDDYNFEIAFEKIVPYSELIAFSKGYNQQ